MDTPSGYVRGKVTLDSIVISFDKIPSIINFPFEAQVLKIIIFGEKVAGLFFLNYLFHLNNQKFFPFQ